MTTPPAGGPARKLLPPERETINRRNPKPAQATKLLQNILIIISFIYFFLRCCLCSKLLLKKFWLKIIIKKAKL